jgi:hypothetical protein
MATMARSMPQFGLLTTLIVFPMQNAICWWHATGEHAQVRVVCVKFSKKEIRQELEKG